MARITTRLFSDTPSLEAGFDAQTLVDAQAVVLLSLGLEPSALAAFAERAARESHRVHSMTSVVAVHASRPSPDLD